MKRLVMLSAAVLAALMGMFTTASAQSSKSTLYNRGYQADVQVGTILDESYAVYTLNTSHGYSFGNGLYVGGGLGVYLTPIEMDGHKVRYQVPVFAEIKYSFLNTLVSPFVDLKAGGFYDVTLNGVGYSIRPSVGVDIWRFSLSVGWDHNRYSYGNGRMGNPGWYVGLSYNF